MLWDSLLTVKGCMCGLKLLFEVKFVFIYYYYYYVLIKKYIYIYLFFKWLNFIIIKL